MIAPTLLGTAPTAISFALVILLTVEEVASMDTYVVKVTERLSGGTLDRHTYIHSSHMDRKRIRAWYVRNCAIGAAHVSVDHAFKSQMVQS